MTMKPAPLLQPFAGVLPPPDKAHLVATRSYLTYSDYELQDKLSRNPFSYLHVIHPEGDARGTGMRPIREAYETFLDRGWLALDEEPAYYVLRQTGPLGTSTGVVGLVSTAAAAAGHVKVHESTLSDRETLFASYLADVGLNAEPTLLAHEPVAQVADAVATVVGRAYDYDFTTADGVRHTLWRAHGADRDALAAAFDGVDSVYIADGHHRVASSIRMAETHPGHADAHAFMALVVPGDQLIFRGYHRMLKELTAYPNLGDRLKRMRSLEGVEWKPSADTLKPADGQIALRGADKGVLNIQTALEASGRTAAEWLQEEVLQSIFGIDEPRTDRRLSYLAGDLELDALEKATSGTDHLAFIMPPMTFEGLKIVADDGRHLPPKSTWIAPKLRSGLTLFDFGPAS